MRGRDFERALKRAAWAEFRINESYRGGVGRYAICRRSHHKVYDDVITQRAYYLVEIPAEHDFDEVDPPRWFVENELGFGSGETSVQWTCEILERKNRRALTILAHAAPYKVTYPRRLERNPRRRREQRAEAFAELLQRALALHVEDR